jgi:hypothetical protein
MKALFVIPKNKHGWFDLSLFAVRAWALLALPEFLLCSRQLDGVSPAWVVLKCEQALAAPLLVSYWCVCTALAVFSLLELFRHKFKQVAWDLVFLVIALFCAFSLYEFETVAMR